MKYAREIKVGVLAVVCIFLLFFGFNFLKGVNIFSPTNAFHGEYANIHGLEEQAPVYIRGFKVGHVDHIRYDFSKDTAFVVDVSINRDIRLPYGTRMALVADGLLGGIAIEMQLPEETIGELLTSGDMLPTIYVPGLVDNLQNELLVSLGKTVNGIDSLVAQLNGQLDNDYLKHTLANVDSMSSDLIVISRDFKGMMQTKIPVVVDNANGAITEIREIAEEVNGAKLAETVARLDTTIDNINLVVTDFRSDNGTIGLLLHDKSLYRNLDATVVSADSLLSDLKANPKRYVHFSLFGRKDKANKTK